MESTGFIETFPTQKSRKLVYGYSYYEKYKGKKERNDHELNLLFCHFAVTFCLLLVPPYCVCDLANMSC
jgi:hypothetical protein